MPKKIGPHEPGQEGTCGQEINSREQKWRRILKILATGAKLTRFDVERYGDHCFNTSVSIIGKKGIEVSRESIVVVGRFGRFRCKRYWIAESERDRVKQLLGDAT